MRRLADPAAPCHSGHSLQGGVMLVEAMIADPASKATGTAWAGRFGLSERTMSRLPASETAIVSRASLSA